MKAIGADERPAAAQSARYRRQPDPGLSRMEIMEGAAVCFQEHGFAGTSIDDIAARICSTKGRIYHHYGSKAELFFDVYRTGMDMNLAGIAPHLAAAQPAVDRLEAMLRSHALAMIRTQAFQRVVWEGVEMLRQNLMPAPEQRQLGELAELRAAYAEHFRTVMDEAKGAGDLDYQNSSIALNTLFMVINGPVFWYRPRDGQGENEIEAIADQCARFAMRALGSRPDREAGDNAESH